jgi:hypothetical protein
MAKAIRAVKAVQAKLTNCYTDDSLWVDQRAVFYEGRPIDVRAIWQRLRWHQAWVDYGDALAKQSRLDRCSYDQIEREMGQGYWKG